MEASESNPEFMKLKRRVQGVINKVTESNLDPLCSELAALYDTHRYATGVGVAAAAVVVVVVVVAAAAGLGVGVGVLVLVFVRACCCCRVEVLPAGSTCGGCRFDRCLFAVAGW